MRKLLVIYLVILSNVAFTQQHTSYYLNDYSRVFSFNACQNKIKLENTSDFKVGDTVLLIQMKGALIDSSNTAAFGNITDYRNCGNYEFNYIKSITGNAVELKNNLTRQYDFANGQVQLVTVPTFPDLDVTNPLICPDWDGITGGVLVFIVADTLNLLQDISASNTGFRGGINSNIISNTLACNEVNYFTDSSSWQYARKGEGIASLGFDKWNGRGKDANGGGGGNGQNSGGGGGSNGNQAGFGGYQLDSCGNVPFDNRGIGGIGLNYNNTANKIFLGGGAGAGQMDSNNPFFSAAGGNGAGIIIIKAGYLRTNNYSISSAGAPGAYCFTCTNDATGGGGAGGTILLDIETYLDSASINANGGDGSLVLNYSGPKERVGPGGGGSGGVIWFTGNIPATARTNIRGGLNGTIYDDSNNPWGATPGNDGVILNNLQTVFDNVPFVGIDSVRIKDSLINCTTHSFGGLVYNNAFPITKWLWDFGDGMLDSAQNVVHGYQTIGNFPVSVTVTDRYGCNINTPIIASSHNIQVDAGQNTTICSNQSVMLQGSSTGALLLAWTPKQFLNDSTVLNPIANPSSTTMFYLTSSVANTCKKTDSVLITVRVPAFNITAPYNICIGDTAKLLATGGDIYLWIPGNQIIANPIFTPNATTTYVVNITDTFCNISNSLSTIVYVLPLPTVKAGKLSNIDCTNGYSQLMASGASVYLWSPAYTLSNPTIANPIASPEQQTIYSVRGIDENGCMNTDTITVKITDDNMSLYFLPTAFTPNNDGLNDCFGLRGWGVVRKLELTVYDRWGKIVFHTSRPGDCWNGKFKGQDQDPGAYIYTISAKTDCGDVSKRGTILLIR